MIQSNTIHYALKQYQNIPYNTAQYNMWMVTDLIVLIHYSFLCLYLYLLKADVGHAIVVIWYCIADPTVQLE